jgi:hypothetical protein
MIYAFLNWSVRTPTTEQNAPERGCRRFKKEITFSITSRMNFGYLMKGQGTAVLWVHGYGKVQPLL